MLAKSVVAPIEIDRIKILYQVTGDLGSIPTGRCAQGGLLDNREGRMGSVVEGQYGDDDTRIPVQWNTIHGIRLLQGLG